MCVVCKRVHVRAGAGGKCITAAVVTLWCVPVWKLDQLPIYTHYTAVGHYDITGRDVIDSVLLACHFYYAINYIT
jgi:hypothetical protein